MSIADYIGQGTLMAIPVAIVFYAALIGFVHHREQRAAWRKEYH